MMQRGEIPTVRLGGFVRVKLEDLEEFIDDNAVQGDDICRS